MILIGTNGVFEIDIFNVLYYWQSNKSIYFYTRFGQVKNIDFANYYECRNASNLFFDIHYKQLFCIPTGSGLSIYINLQNLVSHSRSTSTISVVFPSKTLAIVCKDTTDATHINNFLVNVFYGFNFLKTFTGNKRYVNPEFTTDISAGIFSNIVTAKDNSLSGDAIIIQDGIYNEEVFFKPGVIFYFEKKTTMLGAFTTPGVAGTNRVLGYGKFDNTWISFDTTRNFLPNELYVEFEEIKAGDRTFYAEYEINLYAKGYSITGADRHAISTLVDYDNGGKSMIDCPNINIDDNLYFGQALSNDANHYLFNAKVTNKQESLYPSGDTLSTTIHLISCDLLTTGKDRAFAENILGGNIEPETFTFNIWNCLFQVADKTNFVFDGNVSDSIKVNYYGYNVRNKTNFNTIETVVSGTILLDSKLNLTENSK